LTTRIPPHRDRSTRFGRFDHGVFVDREPHLLAGFDEMIAKVAVACQPDFALNHRQFTAQTPEVHRFTGLDKVGRATNGECALASCRARFRACSVDRLHLRIHHQSPALV
jgi:hypothetical protein